MRIHSILLSFLFCFSFSAFAQLEDWSMKASLTIQAQQLNSNLDSFPLIIHLPLNEWISNSLLQADAADLRIATDCAGMNLVQHYTELDSLVNPLSPVHIRLTEIASEESVTLFVFYHNPLAIQTSDFDAVYPNSIRLLTQAEADAYTVDSTQTDWFELGPNVTWSPSTSSVISIQADLIRLQEGALIDLTGMGFQPNPTSQNGNGPGAGEGTINLPFNFSGAGAGYGGNGSEGTGIDSATTKGGLTYGNSSSLNIQFGSSGGSSDSLQGGAGGGAISFYAIYTQFLLNSSVQCLGTQGEPDVNGTAPTGGSGSGGGILIQSPRISLDNSVRLDASGVNGSISGTAYSGGASGGGRIKLFSTQSAIIDPVNFRTNGGATPSPASPGSTFADTLTADSLPIQLSLQPIYPAQLIIEANSDSICRGSSISVNANLYGQQIEGQYKWFVNGTEQIGQSNSILFLDSVLTSIVVTAEFLPNSNCLSGQNLSSNQIVVSITDMPQLTVSIDANSLAYCDNEIIKVAANTQGFGNNARFEWLLDGTIIQSAINSTVTLPTAINGSQIQVNAYSNDQCNLGQSASSNIEIITVNPTVSPNLSFTPDLVQLYCASDSNLIKVEGDGFGKFPIIRWTIDGILQQESNSPFFLLSGVTAANNVEVEVISSLECASPTPVVTALPLQDLFAPVTDISITPANGICPDTSVIFHADLIDPSNDYTVTWYKNGSIVQNSLVTEYFASQLKEGDSIFAVLSANYPCLNPPSVIDTSNIVKIDSLQLGAFSDPGILCPSDNQGITEFINYSGASLDPTSIRYLGDAIIDSINGEYNSNLRVFTPDTVFVEALDLNGCAIQDFLTIQYFDQLTINLPGDTIVCQDTFLIEVGKNPFVSGGAPFAFGDPYLFEWETDARNNVPFAVVSPSIFDQQVVVQTVNLPEPDGIPADFATTMVILNAEDQNCVYRDSFLITQLIEVRVDLNADTSVCPGDSLQLAFNNNIKGGNGELSFLWEPAGDIPSPNQLENRISPIQNYTYSLTVYDQLGCTDSDVRNVNVFDRLLVERPNDTTVCPGDSLAISVSVTGGEGAIDAVWSPQTIFTQFDALNTVAIPTDSITIYTLLVTDQAGCSSEMTFSSRMLDTSLRVILGDSVVICNGEAVKLNGQEGIIGGTAPYTVKWTPNANLLSDVVANTTATPSSSIEYTMTVQDAFGCNIESDVVTITVNPNPLVILPDNLTSCIADSVRLGDTVVAFGGSEPYTYDWSPKVGLDAYNIPNPLKTNAATVNYTLVVTDSLGCSASAVQSAIINDSPELLSIPDATSCKDELAQIGFLNPAFGGTPPYTFAWSPANLVDDSTAAFTAVIADDSTDFTLVVTDKNGCTDTSDVIAYTPFPDLGLELQDSIFACQGDSVLLSMNAKLNADVSSLTLVQWQNFQGLGNVNDFNTKAKAIVSRKYVLEVIDQYGCEYEDSTRLFVEPQVDFSIRFEKFTEGTFETEVQFILEAFNLDSIIWDLGNGTVLINPGDTFTYVFAQATDIQICVTGFNNRSSCQKDTCFIVPEWIFTNSIEIPDSEISVYPIPSQDFLNIQTDLSVERILVLDMNGNQVKELRVGRNQIQDLPSANYIIEIQTEKGIQRRLIQKL